MSYAGFQRYEVPDIGGNVAKIMLAQQDVNAKRDALKQANALKQAKLEADKAKVEGKAMSDVDKEIEKNDLLRNKELNQAQTTPTGFSNYDNMLQGKFIPFVKEKALLLNKQYKNGEISSSEYKTRNQALLNLDTQLKNTGDGLLKAYDKINSQEDASPFSKWVLNNTVEKAVPYDDNLTDIDIKELPNGEYQIVSKSVKNNFGIWQTTETPLNVLNSISQLPNTKMMDFEKELLGGANSVGKKVTEAKRNGGTETHQKDVAQKEWKDTRERYTNRILASPKDATDAYLYYLNTDSHPVILIDAMATDKEREKKAIAAGYKSAKDADFIVVKTDEKGMPIPELSKKQKSELEGEIAKSFDAKADDILSLSLGSTNNINIKMYDEKTPNIVTDTYDLNTNTGYSSAVFLLNNAKNRGDLYKYKFIKDKNGKYTGDIEIVQKIGTSEGMPIPGEAIVINGKSTDPAVRKLYNQVMGYSGDAQGMNSQLGAVEQKNIKK